ncbi:hypothetical protein RJZ56_006651 [Blastomyces dermatitidis]|uniref:Thiol methyltransferase n=2 Tax=Blastomyces TaxID=229219 RepID=A0A179UNR5_BLAGS|nr:thiol methyltransferase [Blastomyces gilchristii SLH14081]EGE83863.1 thiol methyltransferase [Blastomyces dermatitidis ATCC 18188]EQL28597.1 hypothetical protein BDFG_08658 [Blastomyces dermatitidis ATCC 26199]OAT08681.1 thiol methyltransferase [Blastomyces gilchristii SLH14081]
MSKPSLTQPKLSDHFSKFQLENQVEAWDELWKNETTPWDRGEYNPALEDTLLQRRGLLGTALQDDEVTAAPRGAESNGRRRKRALVPGCGRGFDVFLLAGFGYDAYGLEYSETAVEICRQEAARVGDNIPVQDQRIGKGKITFVQGDFFKNDWLETIGVKEGGFDLIYDYTFFCALNPALRPRWAARMTQLLAPSPNGNLICLEFPAAKDPAAAGPPFASPPAAYMEHLSHPGEDIPYENGHIKTDPLKEASPAGLERVAHWQPERTHEVGKDDNGNVQDWVAIWRRRD